MKNDEYTFPLDAIHAEFLGDAATAAIPFSEGLVPLNVAKSGDVVALNNQYAGPNSEGENPTFEPDDWGVRVSVKTETGFESLDPIDLSPNQMRACAAALFVPATRRVIAHPIWEEIHKLCRDDRIRRGIVVTQTAQTAAIVTTNEDWYQVAFEYGKFDDPSVIKRYVKLMVQPCETAHERIEMRETCRVFLEYVSETFLSEAACGSPIRLVPGEI
jgi:hypothetical protein